MPAGKHNSSFLELVVREYLRKLNRMGVSTAMVTTTSSTVISLIIISTTVVTIHGSIMETKDGKDACDVCPCVLYDQGIYVDCSSRNLKTVPKNIPEASFVIDLNNNSLEYIPQNAFSNATKLKCLFLAKNQIRELPESLLANNTEIRQIRLSYNMLQELPESIFASNGELKTIEVLHNILEKLPEKVFAYPNNLELINLEDNRLEHLPHNIFFNAPTLKTL
ncbi:Slit-like 1 protein [Holothuria leucospilota]|uniref:Slit-like 1 protein n=1 Tax=Holothuria leucospilota TaxID=206669 RepID=A0A9Q1CMF2_HOLLE|nr:Slit-like 1 protein [Holothuria leucospilota]